MVQAALPNGHVPPGGLSSLMVGPPRVLFSDVELRDVVLADPQLAVDRIVQAHRERGPDVVVAVPGDVWVPARTYLRITRLVGRPGSKFTPSREMISS